VKRKWTKRYTMMDELLASPTEPLPQAWRTSQLTKMYEGLHQLEQGDDPQPLLDVLPARTMVRCHRLTEKRIQDMLDGKRRPHDVEICDL